MKEQKKTSIQNIMEKSGNGFHSRVVKLLRDQEWTVLVSPYYSDNFTDKPREIDIVAEKKFDVRLTFGEFVGTVNAHLFVECKYINTDTVFWFDQKDTARAIERIMTDTRLDHPNQNESVKGHHYFKDVPVAKLFSSEKGQSEENQVINKAINQNLNAVVYHRDKPNLISKGERAVSVKRRIPYPIIVVNSFKHFYGTSMTDETATVNPITEPFQLEVNYAYMDKNKEAHSEYFLIDVVSIEQLPEFLSTLENNDINLVTYKVREDEGQNRRNNRSNIAFDSFQ